MKLVLEGEQTDIDKAIAEDVADPLLHMVRNSIDHGIESAEERLKKGKPETGTVIMRALHAGNSIIIEVEDDGKGINKDKILEKAIERGLTTAQQAETMAEKDILAFVFAPGFSTAEKVTDISGRGVGMDVVNNNIKKLGGKISISTTVDVGTLIKLELPLTMAVLDSLLVRMKNEVFALPLESVLETLKIRSSDLKSVAGKFLYSLRGEIITVEWLQKLIDKNSRLEAAEFITVLVMRGEHGKTGLVVDSIFRQEEIVVKALPDYLSESNIVSGASILGDGRAILIIDTNKLEESANAA